MTPTIIKVALVALASQLFSASVNAAMGDDPLLTKVMAEIEYLPTAERGALEWDIDAWLGVDLHKLWVKSSGELVRTAENANQLETESANIELVYSRAVYTTWDQQFGIRRDFKPSPNGEQRDWVSFGYLGTAPYFVQVDARVFVGEEESTQLLIELEREIMLTQEWVLTPELDIVANGRNNSKYQEGSGLAEIEFSLRLGYEANGNRKFQPFIAFSAQQAFAGTKRFRKASGHNSGDFHALIGIHSWF